MFLREMAEKAGERVEMRRKEMPSSVLEAISSGAGDPPSFQQALSARGGGRIGIIAEIKRCSPSRGPLRPNLVLENIVRSYEKGGACAISVLTEPTCFGGDISDLQRTGDISNLPLLRKDFIVDGYQVLEARAAGAAAVLLIAAILEKAELATLQEECRRLGMESLVEIHDESELDTALEAGARIVGINNRNLRTLEVDLGITRRLAPLVPQDITLVGESGYRGRDQVEEALELGLDAILVGEALVRRERPEELIAELRGDSRDAG
ncbi:MAG: indole-3-glycerol phosphate synthase TrpC [Actinomycetota bacterium]|nr:indole-3-glycerol phosphate synthase TrpC [Actinomycetota bacterium]